MKRINVMMITETIITTLILFFLIISFTKAASRLTCSLNNFNLCDLSCRI